MKECNCMCGEKMGQHDWDAIETLIVEKFKNAIGEPVYWKALLRRVMRTRPEPPPPPPPKRRAPRKQRKKARRS